MGYQEKSAQVTSLQKKLEELERQNGKQKIILDRKKDENNEMLLAQVKQLQSEMLSLTNEKSSLQATLNQAKVERRELAHKIKDITVKMQVLKEDNASKELKMSHDLEEIAKLREANGSQATEFRETLQAMKQKELEMKEDHQRESLSFEKQKSAYLARINELERKLNQIEDHLTDKNSQLEKLKIQFNQIEEGKKNELKASEKHLQETENELQHLKTRIHLQADNFNKEIESLQEQISKIISERDQSENALHDIICSLKHEVQKHEANYNLVRTEYNCDISQKEQIINVKEKETQELKNIVEQLQEDSKYLRNTMNDLEIQKTNLIKALEEESLTSKEKIDKLTSSLNEAQKNSMELSVAHSKLVKESSQTHQSLKKSFEMEKQKLENSLSEVQEDKRGLEKQIEHIKSSFNETKDQLAAEKDLLQCDLEATRKKYMKHIEEHEILERDFAESTARFETIISTMQSSMASMQLSSEKQVSELRTEKYNIQKKVELLNSTVDSLQLEIKDKVNLMDASSSEHMKYVYKAQSEHEKLQKELNDSQIKLSDLETKYHSKNEAYTDALSEHQRIMSEKEFEISELKKLLALGNKKEEDLLSDIMILKSNLESAEGKLKIADDKNAELHTMFIESSSECKEKCEDLEFYKKKFTEFALDSSNLYQILLEKNQQEADSSNCYLDLVLNELDSKSVYISNLETKNDIDQDALNSAFQAIFTSQLIIDALERQILEYENLCDLLERSFSENIQKFIEHDSVMNSEISEIREKYFAVCEKLERFTERLESSSDECRQLEIHLDNEKRKSNSLANYIMKLSEQLSINYSELEKYSDEISVLDNKLQSACDESHLSRLENKAIKEKMSMEVSEAQGKIFSLQSVIDTQQQRLDLNEKTLNDTKSELKLLENSQSILTAKNQQLVECLEAEKITNERITKNLNETIENLNEKLKISSKEIESNLLYLDQEKNVTLSLKEETLLLKTQLGDLNSRFLAAKEELRSVNEKLQINFADLSSSRSEYETLQETYNQLNELNIQANNELESQKNQLEALKNTSISKGKEIEALLDHKSRLEYDLSCAKDSISDMESQINSSKESLRNSENYLHELQGRYDNLVSKNGEVIATLDETRALLSTKAADWEIEKTDLVNHIKVNDSKLQTKIQECLTQTQQISSIKNEMQKLQGDLKDSNNKIASTEAKLVAEGQKVASLLDMVRLKKQEIETEISTHNLEIKRLRAEFDDKEKCYKVLVSDIETKLNAKNMELDELEKRLAAEHEKNALEKSNFNAETQKLKASLQNTEKDLASAQNKASHFENQYNELQANCKKEYAKQLADISQLKSCLENETKKSNDMCDDLTYKLAEKAKDLKQAEMDKKTAESQVELVEIKLTNEISTKQIQIKSLEGKLKEYIKQLEKANEKLQISEKTCMDSKEAYKLLELEMKEIEGRKAQFEKETKIKNEERKMYEARISELEAQVQTWTINSEQYSIFFNLRLKVDLEIAHRSGEEAEAKFNSQLQLLKDRGSLNESEVKKIAELNAELFGHNNSKQKIKHVALIKEENVKLRTVCYF